MSELDGASFADNIASPDDGARIAAVEPDGTVDYHHTGALRTTRAITGANATNLLNCGQNASHPYGSMLTYSSFGAEIGGCTQSLVPHKFTGQYRDAESTLDYFGARYYYQSNLGRFLSPDWSATPEAAPYADPDNPLSLNLYSYVLDSPVSAGRSRRALLLRLGAVSAFRWVSGIFNDQTGQPSNTTGASQPQNCGNNPRTVTALSADPTGVDLASQSMLATANREAGGAGRVIGFAQTHPAALLTAQIGSTSSIDRELRNFRQLLRAYRAVLK